MFKEIDEQNRAMVEAWIKNRPRAKTQVFDQLLHELGSPLLAEIMWVYWGASSPDYLDWPMPALNTHLRWWKFGQERRTIRKLIQTPEGRAGVWQMLHDAGAWL
jgi:hypothetical protein